MPAAILFDLDGTLVDSYPAIQASVNYVRELRGLEPLPIQAIRRAVGRGVRRLIETTIPAGNLDENIRKFIEHHPQVLLAGSTPIAGVQETLPALVQARCQLGVCSNKPVELTRKLLKLLNLEQYFTVTFGPELVARPKPAPDMLLAAMQSLRVSPSETLYVGDMTIDIETARAARLPVWVIATGSQTTEELLAGKPDRLMSEFTELLDLVACPAA